MSRPQPKPTDAELAILRVLWERGASTVRQVHEALADTRDTGYTTTLKLMQIMAEKGLVKRNESERTHVYSPVAGQAQTERQLVQDLVDRAFGGSAAQLVLRAISAEGTTDAELKEIRKLIDDYREKR
jgi:BlaI family transcriptional regulator, penicillinase repressor